jgi:hypothetical protein
MPRSIKDATRDVSFLDPQDLEEEESPNKHDEFLAHGKQGESAAADDNELLVGHYYTTQNGDIPDPSDSDDKSSQGRDSMSSFATIHTRIDGDSSKLCERSSVSDVVEVKEQVNFITTISVATLALGSRPRQRGCKGAGQKEVRSHITYSREWKKV